jgi:hypothetical protein
MLKDMTQDELLEALNDDSLTTRRRIAIATALLNLEDERKRLAMTAKDAGIRWPLK